MKEKIREYYHIENTLVFESTVKKIVHRFAKLGGLMLNGWAGVHRLWINADGTEYEFSGDTVTEDYHRIIRAIGSASRLEIVAKFMFKDFIDTEIYLFSSDIADHLDRLVRKNGINSLDGIFYSMCQLTDDNLTVGELIAYGKSNGQIYTGDVDEDILDSLPEGNWTSSQVAVVRKPEPDELLFKLNLISIEMALLYGYNIDTILQSGMWYYSVDLSIKNESELADLVSEYNHTRDKAKNEHLVIISLVEETEKGCRIAHVGICDDGSYKILYQSIK
ncbi:MAG: hypothetical protein U0M02_00745 [Acutalibacteraceae bacterium]|nr:hypothetical protein [Acutalibacteraceae bacterium]